MTAVSSIILLVVNCEAPLISFLYPYGLNQWDNFVSKLSPDKIIKYNNHILSNTSRGLLKYDTYNKSFSDYDLNNPNTCL